MSNTKNRIKKKLYQQSTNDYYRLYYVDEKGRYIYDSNLATTDLDDSYGMWLDEDDRGCVDEGWLI